MVPNTRRLTRATVCNSRKGCKRMYVYASAERKRPAIQRAPEGNLLPGSPTASRMERQRPARASRAPALGDLSFRDSSSLMPLEVSQWTPFEKSVIGRLFSRTPSFRVNLQQSKSACQAE